MGDGIPGTVEKIGSGDLQSDRRIYLVAGICGILIAAGYVFITSAYVRSGTPLPSEGEEWITYLTGKSTTWWFIISLSVITDLLYLPVALGLYLVLGRTNKGLMLLSSACFSLFVILEISISWTNFAALIGLVDKYNSAVTEAQRAVDLASIEYASTVIATPVLPFYAIFMPALAMIAASVAMLRGSEFKRFVAYIGLASGVLAAASVIGGLFSESMGQLVIPASILSLAWFFLVGVRLLKMGGS